MIKVLFVCLGNICRSPTAEGVFRRHIEDENLNYKIEVDSAGTSGWHINEPPDERAQLVAKNRGVELSSLRSRKVTANDFKVFNYIIAMDEQNLTDLNHSCPNEQKHSLSLLLTYAPELNRVDVPDPYYHGSFEEVFDMIELGSKNLLDHIKKNIK